MYQFSYDPDRALLSIVQEGYWSMPEYLAYELDYIGHHERIRSRQKHYRVIADCRNYPVQSLEVSQAFGLLFQRLMADNHAHNAIIVGSTLNRIQAKRAIPQANVQVFTDVEEAMVWLFEEGSLPG